MTDTSPNSNEKPAMKARGLGIIKVICPKHGEHEHVIMSNVDGHEGAWCQLCWLESLGPSLPYRTTYEAPDA